MRDRYRETPPECPMCGDWGCDGDCPEADEKDRFESDNWREITGRDEDVAWCGTEGSGP